ncbi:MAG: hypothetical protein ACXWG0_02710 [Chthoniobacterales bacterium]
MKKLICTLFLASAALCLAGAPEAPQDSSDKAQSAPEVAPLVVKNKSSFAMDESGRNPFWPIGWKPAPKKLSNSGPEHAGPEIRETAFLLTSITMSDAGTRFAIINGKVMSEGQAFGLQMGSQIYQLTVKAIQDGQVILQRRDQEIVVPLRRK